MLLPGTLMVPACRWEGNGALGSARAGQGPPGRPALGTAAQWDRRGRFGSALACSPLPAAEQPLFFFLQPHLLHGRPLLHQQDLLHSLPVRSARCCSHQGCRQRQEEELMSRRPFPGAAPSPPGCAGALSRPIKPFLCSFLSAASLGLVPPSSLSPLSSHRCMPAWLRAAPLARPGCGGAWGWVLHLAGARGSSAQAGRAGPGWGGSCRPPRRLAGKMC